MLADPERGRGRTEQLEVTEPEVAIRTVARSRRSRASHLDVVACELFDLFGQFVVRHAIQLHTAIDGPTPP
ncbi:MAG: hypothetical protein JWP01_2558 [Myxococcales bacterium]|nr:hypothetical protein [Myxococcales bacterium]